MFCKSMKSNSLFFLTNGSLPPSQATEFQFQAVRLDDAKPWIRIMIKTFFLISINSQHDYEFQLKLLNLSDNQGIDRDGVDILQKCCDNGKVLELLLEGCNISTGKLFKMRQGFQNESPLKVGLRFFSF